MNHEHLINQALDALDQAGIDLLLGGDDSDAGLDATLDRIAANILEARSVLISLRPVAIGNDRIDEAMSRLKPDAYEPKESEPKPLPKLTPGPPQNKTGLHRYRARDVSCPKCKAKKGEPCTKMKPGRPNNDGSVTPTGNPAANQHPERTEKAKLAANPHLRESGS